MKGLIVVHTERGYLDPEEIGKESARKNKQLFKNISNEIARYLQLGRRVYCLAEKKESPDFIRQHSSPDIRYIPPGSSVEDLLRAKEIVMADGIDEIAVVGVAYHYCVGNMYHLLLGEEHDDVDKKFYYGVSRDLGWSKKKFEKIFNTRLNAQIRKELTDKLF